MNEQIKRIALTRTNIKFKHKHDIKCHLNETTFKYETQLNMKRHNTIIKHETKKITRYDIEYEKLTQITIRHKTT